MMAGTGGGYTPPRPARVERASGVTGADGLVTFTWPAGAFAVPPVVTVTAQTGSGFVSVRLVANGPGSSTAEVLRSAGVTLLGIGVLAVGAAASGVTVHAVAVAA